MLGCRGKLFRSPEESDPRLGLEQTDGGLSNQKEAQHSAEHLPLHEKAGSEQRGVDHHAAEEPTEERRR